MTSLTSAQLTQIFTTAAGVTIGGVKIYGCDIQSGSGTGQTWRQKLTGSQNPLTTTTVCDGAIDPATGVAFGGAQEQDGFGLVARGDAVDAIDPGAQVIVGMSVGGYIAKVNNVSAGGMPTTVTIGTISDISVNNPVTGTAPNLVGDTAFYASTFGRDLYNVLPASVINSAFGNDAIKQMFKGATSKVCLATVTIQKFGFLPLATCGDSTTLLRGA